TGRRRWLEHGPWRPCWSISCRPPTDCRIATHARLSPAWPSLALHLMLQARLGDVAARRDAARQPDIAADGRALANGDAAEDGCAGVDHHVVLDDRVTRAAIVQMAGICGV